MTQATHCKQVCSAFFPSAFGGTLSSNMSLSPFSHLPSYFPYFLTAVFLPGVMPAGLPLFCIVSCRFQGDSRHHHSLLISSTPQSDAPQLHHTPQCDVNRRLGGGTNMGSRPESSDSIFVLTNVTKSEIKSKDICQCRVP